MMIFLKKLSSFVDELRWRRPSFKWAMTTEVLKSSFIADSKFLSDDAGMSVPENMVFTMNAVDYLAGEKELIALRSREITNRPLDEIEDATRSRWKWANVLLPSIIIVEYYCN